MDDLSAGNAALAEGRWAEARAAFERAVAVDAGQTGDRATAMDGLGQALWWLGVPRESVLWRERAYAAFRRDGRADLATMAALGVAITYESNFGNTAVASGWAARAERVCAEAAASTGTGALDGWVSSVRAYLAQDADDAVDLSLKALERARAAGDVDLELCALSGLGEARVARGEIDEGLALVDEAMAGVLAGEYRILDTVVYVACDMLVACAIAADVQRATQWCQVANRFTEQYGCPFLYARCRILYGRILVATGDWSAAERELQQAVRMADDVGPAVAAQARAGLADLRLRQGRIEEAEALLSGCDGQLAGMYPAAAIRLARGEPAVAAALLQRCLDRGTKFQADAAAGLAVLVEAHLAGGDRDAAAQATARLRALPAAGRGGYAGALATFAAARVAGDALTELAAAADRFAALGLPYESAKARLGLAQRLSSDQPQLAIAEAGSALATLRRLGAASDADAAAALLRSLGAPASSVGAGGRGTPVAGTRGAGAPVDGLTGREREVLALVALGLSNPEIARRLFISRKTAAHHVSNILAKLGLRNRAEAVAHAIHSA